VCSSIASEKLRLTASACISKRGSRLRYWWWDLKSYCEDREKKKLWIWYINVSLDGNFKWSIFIIFYLILIKELNILYNLLKIFVLFYVLFCVVLCIVYV